MSSVPEKQSVPAAAPVDAAEAARAKAADEWAALVKECAEKGLP